jgi:antitoxin component of MazEF toxin-antitoxin module
VTTYTTTTIGDGEDAILLLPDELVEELGWRTGTDLLIQKEGDVIGISRLKKPRQRASGKIKRATAQSEI